MCVGGGGGGVCRTSFMVCASYTALPGHVSCMTISDPILYTAAPSCVVYMATYYSVLYMAAPGHVFDPDMSGHTPAIRADCQVDLDGAR